MVVRILLRKLCAQPLSQRWKHGAISLGRTRGGIPADRKILLSQIGRQMALDLGKVVGAWDTSFWILLPPVRIVK